MTKPSSTSAANKAIGLSDRRGADFHHHHQPISAIDREPCQRLITTAILATTAFRMRDDGALVEALRLLVRAVKPFENHTADEQDRPEEE